MNNKISKENKEETLLVILDSLKNAHVQGEGEKDEPEGTRYIQMTDTFRKKLINKIDSCFIDSPDIAICNGLKFGEIEHYIYSKKREMAPICTENITEEELKEVRKENIKNRGISGSVIFKKINNNIIKSFDNKQIKFNLILIEEDNYVFLLNVSLIKKGKDVSVNNIKNGKKYTFVANSIFNI